MAPAVSHASGPFDNAARLSGHEGVERLIAIEAVPWAAGDKDSTRRTGTSFALNSMGSPMHGSDAGGASGQGRSRSADDTPNLRQA